MEKQIIKDVKDRDSNPTSYVVRSENEFLGCHTIKNVQKKSFTDVVHFILSQSIKYFDISLLNDSRSFKFVERSHTLVQIWELYSEDVLIILCRIWNCG
jgi:hypothetical protein